MKKRLKLQTEEFEMAFSRNEALVNEMAVEKRTLQDKLDKLINNFNEAESKYREHVKALQQKHLDEIKRIRKANLQAENSRKQQWVGNKTQEIKVCIILLSKINETDCRTFPIITTYLLFIKTILFMFLNRP